MAQTGGTAEAGELFHSMSARQSVLEEQDDCPLSVPTPVSPAARLVMSQSLCWTQLDIRSWVNVSTQRSSP